MEYEVRDLQDDPRVAQYFRLDAASGDLRLIQDLETWEFQGDDDIIFVSAEFYSEKKKKLQGCVRSYAIVCSLPGLELTTSTSRSEGKEGENAIWQKVILKNDGGFNCASEKEYHVPFAQQSKLLEIHIRAKGYFF